MSQMFRRDFRFSKKSLVFGIFEVNPDCFGSFIYISSRNSWEFHWVSLEKLELFWIPTCFCIAKEIGYSDSRFLGFDWIGFFHSFSGGENLAEKWKSCCFGRNLIKLKTLMILIFICKRSGSISRLVGDQSDKSLDYLCR